MHHRRTPPALLTLASLALTPLAISQEERGGELKPPTRSLLEHSPQHLYLSSRAPEERAREVQVLEALYGEKPFLHVADEAAAREQIRALSERGVPVILHVGENVSPSLASLRLSTTRGELCLVSYGVPELQLYADLSFPTAVNDSLLVTAMTDLEKVCRWVIENDPEGREAFTDHLLQPGFLSETARGSLLEKRDEILQQQREQGRDDDWKALGEALKGAAEKSRATLRSAAEQEQERAAALRTFDLELRNRSEQRTAQQLAARARWREEGDRALQASSAALEEFSQHIAATQRALEERAATLRAEDQALLDENTRALTRQREALFEIGSFLRSLEKAEEDGTLTSKHPSPDKNFDAKEKNAPAAATESSQQSTPAPLTSAAAEQRSSSTPAAAGTMTPEQKSVLSELVHHDQEALAAIEEPTFRERTQYFTDHEGNSQLLKIARDPETGVIRVSTSTTKAGEILNCDTGAELGVKYRQHGLDPADYGKGALGKAGAGVGFRCAVPSVAKGYREVNPDGSGYEVDCRLSGGDLSFSARIHQKGFGANASANGPAVSCEGSYYTALHERATATGPEPAQREIGASFLLGPQAYLGWEQNHGRWNPKLPVKFGWGSLNAFTREVGLPPLSEAEQRKLREQYQ